MTEEKSQPPFEVKPSVWQVILSVIAAMFGMQSQEARERDFQHGNPWVFIVVGVIAVILLVLMIYGLVKWVIFASVNAG